MANYIGTVKSNEFLVINKEKTEIILDSVETDGEFYYDIVPTNTDGVFKCWFGSTGSIFGINTDFLYGANYKDEEDCEPSYDLMISELQNVLIEDSYIKIVDVGYEKLRYVGGGCLVITKNDCKYVDISEVGDDIAHDLLENNNKN